MSVHTPVAPDTAEADPPRETWDPVMVVSTVVMVVMIALATFNARGPLVDPDLWWHLRAGEGYLNGWSLASPPAMTSFATESWYSLSWLPEIVFAQIHAWFGLPGVAWFHALTLLTVVATIYWLCRREAGLLAATTITVVAVMAASPTMTARPQLAGFLILLLVTAGWRRAAASGTPPWWIIPVTWIWSMIHGMWLAGILVGIGVVIGMALDGRLTRSNGLRMAAVPVLATATTAISPVGFTNTVAFLNVSGFDQYISEYAAPRPTFPNVAFALVLVAVVVVTLARHRDEMAWSDIAILAQATFWILYTVRSVPWGVMMLAPMAAGGLQAWLKDRPRRPVSRPEVTRLGAAMAVCLVALAIIVPSTAAEPGRVPSDLNETLADLPDDTILLNEYGLGGWLIWRHPHIDPVIDGNTNQYTVEALATYMEARDATAGWDEYVATTGASHALVFKEDSLATALEQRLGWDVVDEDETLVLLVDPAAG